MDVEGSTSSGARGNREQGERSGEDRTLFAGRYRLGRMLKRGNGVDTLLATDAWSGAEVVLKSIDAGAVHAAARLRFEHETRVLRQLSGSGLVELYDYGEAGDRLYLVQ